MARLADYTIDHAGLDWPDLLANWAWLAPSEFRVWLMNRFGDLFLVMRDGSVHVLDVGCGTLKRVADDRDQFASLLDLNGNANEWLMIPLVDRLRAAGVVLGAGECYSYILLPILGGEYSVANTRVVPISTHFKAFGPIHEGLKDVPDGTTVRFEIAPGAEGRRRTRG